MLKILLGLSLPLILLTLTSVSQQSSAPALGETPVLFRADVGRTGVYNYPAIRELPALKWELNIGPTSYGSPVYADGTVFKGTLSATGSQGMMRAFGSDAGDRLWRVGGFGSHVSPVAVSGDFLFVGAGSNKILALDRRSGAEIWSFPTAGPVRSAPLIIGQDLFVLSQSGAYALDAATGAQKWFLAATQREVEYGPLAFSNGLLYFTLQGIVFAVNATTGRVEWQKTLDQICYPLAVAEARVFIGCLNGYFYALQADNGQQVWRFGPRGIAWSAPVVVNGQIYVGNYNKELYALNSETGSLLWTFTTEDIAASDPLYSDGVLYLGSGDHHLVAGRRYLYAVDAVTGSELWKFQTDGLIFTAPALSENAIYVVTFAGHLYALE